MYLTFNKDYENEAFLIDSVPPDAHTAELPLQSTWVLWVQLADKTASYAEQTQKLHEFNNVQVRYIYCSLVCLSLSRVE